MRIFPYANNLKWKSKFYRLVCKILELLKSGITDIEICEEDLKNAHSDFNNRYSNIYNENNNSRINKKMIEALKFDFIQFRRRTYIRTAFANIEGVVFAIKEKILDCYNDKISIKDNIKLNQKRIKLIDNINFMFSTYSELRGEKNGNVWYKHHKGNLETAIKIRNKITHPKKGQDLIISSKDFLCVNKVHKAFFKYLYKLEKDEI